MNNHITTLKVRNKSFEIVQDERGFWAIEDKYITDGKLNKQINGISGHLKNTLEECIESAKFSAEVEYVMTTEKCDVMTAFNKILKLA